MNFSKNGDQLISGGNDKQVIIWKTNFEAKKPQRENAASSTQKQRPRKTALEQRIVADIGPPLGEPGFLPFSMFQKSFCILFKLIFLGQLGKN